MNRARKVVAAALVAVAVGVGTLFVADSAQGTDAASSDDPPHLTPEQQYQTDPVYRGKVDAAHKTAVRYQGKARYWRHKRMAYPQPPHANRLRHLRSYHRPLPSTHNLAVEVQRAKMWRGIAGREYLAYRAQYRWWVNTNRSMWRAVEAAAKEYGVSASWLHACVSTEGGHGGWVMNHQGSGAGGWFQFMESTFTGNVHSARRTNRFPRRYAKWRSRVGQAYTAAYMFKIGQSGQWTGAGC